MQTIQSIPENDGKAELDGPDVDWLENELKRVLDEEKGLCFSLEDLVNIIYDRFQDNSYSDDVFQNDLLNLLGLNQIELIGEIIQNRGSLIRSFKRRLGQFDSQSTSATRPKQPKSKPIFYKEPKLPSFTQTITIQTEQELREHRLLNKLERKTAFQERKRQRGNNDYDDEMNGESNYTLPDLTNEASEFNFYLKRLENERVPREELPFVFDLFSNIKQTPSFVSNQKLLLPEGTDMKDLKSYKEITVPPPEKPKKELLENYPLVSIDSLDKLSQKIFTGYKTLNQIQSVVYETASKTNENILVSAPTGAGKTNVSLLAMINEIKKNMCPDTGKINKDNFKIIYVTPMKALASEMTDNFSKRLSKSVGLVVKELTGDMQLTWEEIKRTQVLVMTPEKVGQHFSGYYVKEISIDFFNFFFFKLDVISRKVKENSQLIDLIKLLIFDEVHLLQTDRGPTVESIVARK